MAAFLEWFNRPPDTDPLTAAALTRLRLVTIHPFDDGNGRIARAISDMCLAPSGGTRQRFYSISAQIHRERNACYRVLEQTQRDGTDVTTWLSGFLGCLEQAIHSADASVTAILPRARFWKSIADIPVNERQARVLTIMLDDFSGNLTIVRWGRIAKYSQAALQDIGELIDRGILVLNPEGAGVPATAWLPTGPSDRSLVTLDGHPLCPCGPSPATIPRSSHRSASSASETYSASEYGLKRTRNSDIHP